MNNDFLAKEYRRMHNENKFGGGSLRRHLPEIKELVKEYGCESVLDYGCGKATHHKDAGLPNVTLYDPYYEPYSTYPQGTYDMVICTDVLEHIPINEVGGVLHKLLNFADKVLFLSISTKPAKKKFSNGENVHVTVQPKEWWKSMLITSKDIKIITHYMD